MEEEDLNILINSIRVSEINRRDKKQTNGFLKTQAEYDGFWDNRN